MRSALSPYSVVKSVRTDLASYFLCSDGVMEIHYGDFQYNLEMARSITNTSGDLCQGQKMLILGVASEFTDIDAEVRNFMSTPEALRYSIAEAYVLKSLSQRILGNFYLKFQHPPVPTRLFSNTSEARTWLLHSR